MSRQGLYLPKKAYFEAKMAVFGSNILIFAWGSKSFGIHFLEKPPRHLVSCLHCFLVGHRTKWAKLPILGPIWPKMHILCHICPVFCTLLHIYINMQRHITRLAMVKEQLLSDWIFHTSHFTSSDCLCRLIRLIRLIWLIRLFRLIRLIRLDLQWRYRLHSYM